MTPQQRNLVEAVRARFGPKAAVTDADTIAPWLTDWRGRFHGQAPAMLAPASTAEVAAIVALAGESGIPLVPQGGNTGMVGGATPPTDGSALLLSLRRMNRIRSVSAADNLAVAEAGVILADLHDAALAVGRRFPLTLGARGSATIGGLVSTNAGGTQVLRFGTMRSLVAGVEAVLPDGSIHDGLPSLKKDNRGYDLNQLLVGAEGTLGIVTAASLRLVPAIAARAVAWVGLGEPAGGACLAPRDRGAQPGGRELRDRPRRDAADGARSYPGHARAARKRAALACADRGGRDRSRRRIPRRSARAAARRRARIRARRRRGDRRQRRPGRGLLAAARFDRRGRARERPRDPARHFGAGRGHAALHGRGRRRGRGALPGHPGGGFGHLGDGNVHFHARAPHGVEPERWYAEQAPAITRLVHDLVVAAGGSISAEHGIGQMKRAELERLGPPSRLAALRAIKQALDPKGILNPGKLVPLAPEPRAP